MRRFYERFAYHLDHFTWGRRVTGHVRSHPRFYENLEALFTALLLALLIKRYLFEAYKIPSGSMRDTLVENDRIFVSKFVYDFADVEVGDVVVFRTPEPIYDPDKPYYIKRVVGLPGDLIEIRGQMLYRNGEPLHDPDFFEQNIYYSRLKSSPPFRSKRVPAGEVFVFGDNSEDSYDSRYWGGVPVENIMGKAVFRYWPPDRIGGIEGVPVRDAKDGIRSLAGEHMNRSGDVHAAGQDR